MITPRFDVSQDDLNVYVNVKATALRSADVELDVTDNLLVFHYAPYYLRLRFPGDLVGDDVKASYNLSTSVLAIVAPKKTPGEHFADLDLHTKLLARVNEPATKPKTSLIAEVDAMDPLDRLKQIYEETEEFNWELDQSLPVDDEDTLRPKAQYGFNNSYSEYYQLQEDTITTLADAESSTPQSRRAQRIESENAKFDLDYFLADTNDTETIDPFLSYVPPITQQFLDWETSQDAHHLPAYQFTEAEKLQMQALPKKQYLLDDIKSTYICLAPILFGYAYDVRTTFNEPTVESAWTIGRLAPNVSALDNMFHTVKDMKIATTRRAIIYPLYRSLDLVEKCWEDVYAILRGGRRRILSVLLAVRDRFAWHDVRYVYNKILFDDYASWIQSASDNVLRSLAHEIKHCKVSSKELGLALEQRPD
ncbi:hypothetical protein CANCADRAFT_2082 [Tortispora caseinolytica NRRL Y-17796]|uniref:CS domain-containing protein n=1 Tax=Tortispora caseinolytica NRRL Y-17796 TaxID=767744 RepID=A0A1E4TF19_9ASCO|nr:hypothetical protein CANCADRAFT_2082 [Tortispora caseinolytica NRRL Y-17796]